MKKEEGREVIFTEKNKKIAEKRNRKTKKEGEKKMKRKTIGGFILLDYVIK